LEVVTQSDTKSVHVAVSLELADGHPDNLEVVIVPKSSLALEKMRRRGMVKRSRRLNA
jgi:hypothetical protein